MDNRPETPETMGTRRYLDLLAAQLHALPPDMRAEQREEVRLHLQAMAAACRELGSGPEAAEREALARFGDPVQVGKSIARKYWPPDVLPGSFALAFGTAALWLTVFYGLSIGGLDFLQNWYLSTGTDLDSYERVYPTLNQSAVYLVSVAPPVLAGWITGLVAPKRAFIGATTAALLLVGGFCAVIAGDATTMINNSSMEAAFCGLSALATSCCLRRRTLLPRWLPAQWRKARQ
jgi:hypothetical protein